MSLKQITCKHCGKVINPPTILIGESEAVRQGKTVQKMAKHIQSRADEEMQQSIASANGKPFKAGPHHAAVIQLQMTIQGISEYAIARNFNLSEDLEKAVELGRHSIHEYSRSVRMTDEDLDAYLENRDFQYIMDGNAGLAPDVPKILRDLRDHYEGLGKYAPVVLENVPSVENKTVLP